MQKQSFITPLTILFLIFSFTILNAQPPKIDLIQQKEFLQQKTKHYQQLYSVEQEITANQQDYDVKYYSLDLIPNPVTSILTGEVEVVAEVVGQSLEQVELNLWVGMTITDIHRSDSPDDQLIYTHLNDLLSIDLDSIYTQGELFRITIVYYGQPQKSVYNSFRFDSYAGENLIWSFSEPFGARAWWPCKDIPSDKADSVDIRVTVPNKFIVASNGTLRETLVDGELTTHWWHEQYPIVTYLVSVAIYPYTVNYDDYLYNDGADTMKIHFYTFPDNFERYGEINARINDMLWVFSQIYGEYPFIEEKYGHADCLLGGAMEHQTCTSFGVWAEWLYVHELAHQWWGDLVTCDSFHHIWLNEGFASYSEAIWFEVLYPEYPASQYLLDNRHYLGGGTVYVEDPENEQIFDGNLSYNKGAWVVHMLRHVMGDSVTGVVLPNFLSAPEHQYGTATTEEFQAICEQVSGMKLNKFFHQWIYEEFYPHYSYGWKIREVEGEYQVKLGIDQIQENTILFWMPIDIKISTSSYDTTFVVWDSLESQTFEFYLNEEPLDVEIDPNNWILKRSEEKLLTPFSKNISIDNAYQIPGIDTLKLVSETVNPDNHNLELYAIIESYDQIIRETISMLDDGHHNDGEADDGVFGVFWPVPYGERSYSITIKTLSLDDGYSNFLNDADYFTTMGPVILNGYEIVSEDTIANPSDFIGLEFTLRNLGTTESIRNVSTKVVSPDTCVNIIAFSDPQYGDIAPGESSVASRVIRIRFDENCTAPSEHIFELEVYSDSRQWWKDSFSIDVVTALANEYTAQPKTFEVHQNYPNPFNPTTIISYKLPITNYVNLSIYDLLGQKVATLVNENKRAGSHQIEWDASGFPSGIYYYRIKAGNNNAVRKMILLR